MSSLTRVLALLLSASTLNAQQAPTTNPATPPDEKPAAPSAPANPSANSPKLNEEINLADSPAAESLEITPPPDSPDPEKTAEITGPLPGEEEPPVFPAVTGTVEVTAQDDGKTIRTTVGNLVRITLESNPSTGYNWELRDFEFGTAVFNSSDLVARKDGNVLFGTPGDTVITLQAVQPGEQDITLVYRRPWEPPDQVAATFRFRLAVDPKEGG
jgi:inhibitor of cysteine peptidase